MAFLTPDRIRNEKIGSVSFTIKVKITPASARKPDGSQVKPGAKLNNGSGKPKGITVHNTDDIVPASGTNAAEQYARATWPNCAMRDVAVHFWVWHSEIWQQLDETERGWHAADGSSRRSSHRAGQTIGGNLDTISIECIGKDAESEETTAKLVAYLLKAHGLSPDTDVYTHNYFYAKKYCPAYILPHWDAFMAKVKGYYSGSTGGGSNTPQGTLYRVQCGAYKNKANADALAAKLKAAKYETYMVQDGGLYKVQVGAFSEWAKADALAAKLKAAGYETFITTKAGTAVS